MPSAMRLSPSAISTRATRPTIVPPGVGLGLQTGEDSVTEREPEDRSFDELRTEFTAAGSHERRTPLARILVLLEWADLPGADVRALLEQARAEVENAGELSDEILFLSELESGKEVVSLGHTPALPILQDVTGDLADAAARAGVSLSVGGDDAEVPLRPRMLRVIAENLAENAIRYAGHGAEFWFHVERAGDFVVLIAA